VTRPGRQCCVNTVNACVVTHLQDTQLVLNLLRAAGRGGVAVAAAPSNPRDAEPVPQRPCAHQGAGPGYELAGKPRATSVGTLLAVGSRARARAREAFSKPCNTICLHSYLLAARRRNHVRRC
jgi:hypothetical protein